MSFDVESLFTNVPLQGSINTILNRIYDDKLIHTDIKKNTMRNLIKDTCKKTAFSFDNVIYEQIDGVVSMGSSLASVLAKIIMTELEKTVVQKLTTSRMITFYCRYVDDTLLLVKPADILLIHNLSNEFGKKLRFIVDRFENEVPHFLDIKSLHLDQQLTETTPTPVNILTLKAILIGITKSAGFKVLLHERKRYEVQIYCQQKFKT